MNFHWSSTTLEKALALIIDYRGKTPKKLGGDWEVDGIPAISAKNIKQNRIVRKDTIKYVSEELYQKWMKYELQEEDIILTSEAPLGEVLYLKDQCKFVLSQRLYALRTRKEIIEPLFLAYYLKSNYGKNELESRATGSTVLGIRQSLLKKVIVRHPSLTIQKKITGVLSAYDDLIENNTRRIAILEEMAQRIYKEWFVDFKYPGHENDKLVESELGPIPEGWEVKKLKNLFSLFVDGDWIETKDQSGEDYRLLQVSNIGIGKFRETENYRYITQETFERLNCTEVKPGNIIISRMPKPTGRAWYVTHQNWKMITAVDIVITEPDKSRSNVFYCLSMLNSSRQLSLVEKYQTGTTRPRISRSNLAALKIISPPITIQNLFGNILRPLYDQIDLLINNNKNLRQTRDFLLPKLISGKVDVSELNIEIGVDA